MEREKGPNACPAVQGSGRGVQELMALSKAQKSLKKWTKQKWRTKSGKNSILGPDATGEHYAPDAAHRARSKAETARRDAIKRKKTKEGEQYASYKK